jgi:hypothetical protein
MGADCCNLAICPTRIAGTRPVAAFWAVLAINAVTFAVEVGAGLAAGSAALQADALDFLGEPVRNRPRPNVRSWGEPVTPDWRE